MRITDWFTRLRCGADIRSDSSGLPTAGQRAGGITADGSNCQRLNQPVKRDWHHGLGPYWHCHEGCGQTGTASPYGHTGIGITAMGQTGSGIILDGQTGSGVNASAKAVVSLRWVKLEVSSAANWSWHHVARQTGSVSSGGQTVVATAMGRRYGLTAIGRDVIGITAMGQLAARQGFGANRHVSLRWVTVSGSNQPANW